MITDVVHRVSPPPIHSQVLQKSPKRTNRPYTANRRKAYHKPFTNSSGQLGIEIQNLLSEKRHMSSSVLLKAGDDNDESNSRLASVLHDKYYSVTRFVI